MGRRWIDIIAPKYLPAEEREDMEPWMQDMDRAWLSSGGIVVYSRVVDTGRYIAEHAAIMREDKTSISWLEKQKIKNELFGRDIEAVEIYPKEYERTCSEGVYHLWLLSNNTVIPFGLNQSRMKIVSRNRKRNPIGFVAEMARMMGIL